MFEVDVKKRDGEGEGREGRRRRGTSLGLGVLMLLCTFAVHCGLLWTEVYTVGIFIS